MVELDADGTTFAADIAADASSVEIGADFAGDTSSFVMTQKDGVNKNTVSNGVTADLALNKYPDAVSGVITIPMVLTSADGAATKTYKLVLTQTTKGTTTNLKSVTAGDKVIDATFDNDTKVISVTVPRGYTSGGTIALETEDNAVIDAGDKTAVSIDDGFIVTSESTGNAASWTFAKTEVDAITSFEIDGVSGVFSKSSGAEFNDTITVTLLSLIHIWNPSLRRLPSPIRAPGMATRSWNAISGMRRQAFPRRSGAFVDFNVSI